MKNFNSNFTQICEETLNAYSQGGFLRGNYVIIKPDALKNEALKQISDPMKAIITDAIKKKTMFRISYIKSGNSEAPSGPVDAPNIATGTLWADVVVEYAPGMWKDPMTLPVEVLKKVELEGEMDGYPQYSSEIKRENDYSTSGAKPVDQTKGDDSNRKLSTKNTKLANTKNPTPGDKSTKLRESVTMFHENEAIFESYTNSLGEGIIDWAADKAKQVGNNISQGIDIRAALNSPEKLAHAFSQLKQQDPEKLKVTIKKLLEQGYGEQVAAAAGFQQDIDQAMGDQPDDWHGNADLGDSQSSQDLEQPVTDTGSYMS